MESTQGLSISSDPETNGFDLSAGKTWIYPENYPLRDYQFTIVKAALYNNTLVCLPTGLGKTFIAAVVMYNFWRWYPRGKVIFLAPTRPLVAQQIDACHNVMGIPSIESIELTGSINQKSRQMSWFKNRVIFATPQVFHNDLENNIIPTELVKCVVIDEAHKALGKHSYCECIRILSEQTQYVRILALSATPGNKIANVHQVVQNLHISHIELRDETSPDILPYINQRKIDTILVPLGEDLEKYKERYVGIMDRHVKRLIQCNVIHGQTANISKGKIFIILRDFQKKPDKSGNYGQIVKTLNILLTMYHAYELLIRHGLRAFYKFYQNHSDKFWMSSECQLQELIVDVENYLGSFPNVQELTNGGVQDIPSNLVFGHNKFLKLKEILLQHFKKASSTGNNTRAIVFVEYRDIVSEVYVLLLQARPLIRPQMFVGQAEQKQKYQVKAIEDFRNNSVNVLISTSIGEEGLDVGEVDLIICFDISQKSPTRLVQRMGRTGRQRDGHIIVLVTDGREHEALKSTMARRESLNSKILNTSNIFSSLYQNNPRMIPSVCTPECHKMHINIQPKTPVKKNKKFKKAASEKINETLTKKTKNSKQPFANEIRSIDQPSMAKFLVNRKSDEEFNSSKNIELLNAATMPTTDQSNTSDLSKQSNVKSPTCDNENNVVTPSNVKLLTCDNQTIDFLTLCTMKKSEQEVTPKISEMDTTYVPVPKSIKNFSNFTVPSIDILNDLAIHLINVKETKLLPEEDFQIDCDNGNDLWFNDQCNITSPVNRTANKCINVSESKFEDLLDESIDSDETVFSADKEDVNNEDNNIGAKDNAAESITNIKCTKAPSSDNGLNTNDFSMNAETSIFEDIFNDSFDSIESDSNIDNTENNELKIMTNYKLVNKEDNVTLPKVQANEKDSKNKTMFTITQAVNEIARINSSRNDGPLQLSVAERHDAEQRITPEKLKDIPTTSKLCLQDIKINDYESEEDMFASELETDFEMNTLLNRSPDKENLRDNILPDEKFNKSVKSVRNCNNEIKTNDIENRNDFKASSNSLTNSKYFKSCTNIDAKSTNNFAKDITREDTDSEEWISVDRRFEPQNEKTNDPVKIAKKLSRTKYNLPNSISQSVSSSRSMEERGSSNNDFVINGSDRKKLHVLEASYLSDRANFKPQDYKTSITNDNDYKNTSLNIVEEKEMTLKSLSSFKASDKYLEKESRNENGNARPNRSKFTKIARNLSNASNKSIKEKKKPRIQCEYIDDEAEVSFDNTLDESSGTDGDLPDFVSYTQHIQDDVDMHAVYLQDMKSPVKRQGAFIFKELQPPKEIDVYSQPYSQAEQSYLQDSFCVDDDHDALEDSKLVNGYCALEEAERILKARKRKRITFDKSESNVWKRRKRRKRIEVSNTSTSSEDETERLRNEIGNQSMVLKGLHL